MRRPGWATLLPLAALLASSAATAQTSAATRTPTGTWTAAEARAADSAWVAGDIPRAESLYAAELARADSMPRALHRLALIRAWAEDYDASLALFDRLLALDPSNVEAALDRARVLSWRNDLDDAAAAYLAVLGEHDDSREARLGLARVRAWKGDLEAAEATYAELLERDPRDVEALAGRARVSAWAGRLEESEARWRAALEHHPDHPVLLTGLGRTLRWQGRSSAALGVLSRAVEVAPDDAEARREYRLARLSVAPRVGPSLVYESDSDGNRMTTLWLDHTVWPGRDVALHANGYVRHARVAASGESGGAYGGLAELRLRIGGEWEVDTGAGATHNTLAGEGAAPQWRVRVATPGRLPAQLWARVWHRALDETAPLMRSGVEIRERSIGVRGTLSGARGELTLSDATFAGAETNRRRAAGLALSRRLGSGWTLGLATRLFGFDRDLNEGYFDPSFYSLTEVRVSRDDRLGDWHLSFELSPGMQKVGSGPGDVSGSARARLSFGREFGPGRIVWLHTGFSSAGLQSFSTAGADYRYYQIALAVGWAF